MAFPKEAQLKKIRTQLEHAEPSRTLRSKATKAEQIKYKLCEKFVEYLLEHEITQVQLAKKLDIHPSRVNEIVKYKIDLFTVDTLLALAEKLALRLQIRVA